MSMQSANKLTVFSEVNRQTNQQKEAEPEAGFSGMVPGYLRAGGPANAPLHGGGMDLRDLPPEALRAMADELLSMGGADPRMVVMAALALAQQEQARADKAEEHARASDRIAHTDWLTGIANRRAFILHAEQEVSRARRENTPLSMVVCDLKNFKQINDVYGHVVGDAAICEAAGTLRAHIRESDVVARLGGDEFAVILPQTDMTGAAAVIDKLAAAFNDKVFGFEQDGQAHTVKIGAHFGAAPFEADDDLSGWIERADKNMYAAKNNDATRLARADLPRTRMVWSIKP